MTESWLTVDSAHARDLATRLALREGRSVTEIVERALESYEALEAGREPPAVFYARLAQEYGTDVDLERLIRETRAADPGPDL